MNPQIERSIDRNAQKARSRYQDMLAGARKNTHKAASRVTRGKKPVKTMSKFGVSLAGASQRAATQLIRQQTRLVEHQMDALAARLRAAADARNLGDLFRTQIRLIPENASRFGTDTREALKIVKGAGGEIAQLVKGTVAELKGQKPVVKRKSAVKKRRPAARKRPVVATRPATPARPSTNTGAVGSVAEPGSVVAPTGRIGEAG